MNEHYLLAWDARIFVMMRDSLIRVHTVRKNQERKYACKGSQEKSGKVMKCQEVLLKLEESQEKVRKFYQLSEFCGDQL